AAAEEVSTLAEETESAEGEVAAEGEELEAGQKEPASAEVESQASAEVAPESDAEDDDDEEEDDITDALDPEDDDDDDEEEDDDDDEEDDITDALGRNISKHSRALKEEPEKKPTVPAAYIVKYNRFVDNILEKMNDILRRSYDPVNVKLQPIDAKKKNSKPKKDKTKSKKKSSTKKKQTKRAGNTAVTENKTVEGLTKTNEINDAPLIDSKIVDVKKTEEQTETRVLKDKSVTPNGKAKPTTTRPKPPTKATKPKPKPPVKTTTKKPVNKNKTKTSEKSKPRAKGTLYGLSSLRRNGDVAVNILSDHTTVKSNFAVGPLVLRVEKEIGRGAKKEIKSATATTAEMTGKITLRVNNQGVATLHSIKVLQPKQVRVDSNHERTRELVWQRSARIAHVVSEKLMSASKPMFYH
ncbi:PREDICTED: nonsense-mediated mRNA decay protein 2-like, partial [Papilio polytes]